MVDNLTKTERSLNMAAIKGKNTKPELVVRKFLFSLGYRYRLHERDLPGCPDIVIKKYRLAVFINGCYWHRHKGCKFAYIPKSRTDFWMRKFRDTVERDEKNYLSLKNTGWKVIVIWECDIKNGKYEEWLPIEIDKRIEEFR